MPRDLCGKLLQITRGRTTAFFIAFFIAGHAMALLGKLTPVYVGFMGTLGGLVLGHSIKEDVVAAKYGPPPGGPDVDAKT
ncbi:MAG: hypothetical protein LAN84_00180 [Acidobacteriia bacterium]|nr:hypothetical protein [Terriglobia bacterium]